MKYKPLLLCSLLLTVGVTSLAADDGATVPCADRSVTAAAVSNRQDIQAFVQCAYGT